MALAYTPPGVSVLEYTSPSAAPLLAVPASVCLLGPAAGVLTRTDAVTLTGTTAVVLPGVPTNATMVSGSIISVMDALNPGVAPTGYTVTTDYTFSATGHSITRVSTGVIPDGALVYVTYTYTPVDYFQPIRLDNMSDIQDRFGSAWNAAGTAINSPLSFAAQIAFENGASTVVLQPLFFNNAGVRQNPTPTQIAAQATWTDNFTALRDLEDINVLVPVVGQSLTGVTDNIQEKVFEAAQDHLKFMKDQDQYIIALFGEDSSTDTTKAAKATLLTHAQTLASRYGGDVTQQCVFIAPSRFSRPTPGSSTNLLIGGQYVAAAIAGMIASRDVSQSLTRKVIAGVATVEDFRSKADKNVDAATGLLVVEQKGGVVLVRHAITMDNTSVARRELSIVRSKHRVIESVRDTIDTQIIGEVTADNDAPFVVRNAVIGVLEMLRGTNDIVDYSDVQARTLTLDPTVIEVRFSYRPAFPVNYVQIGFSLDLTSNDLTVSSDGTDTTF